MAGDGNDIRDLSLPNTLELSADHTTRVVGSLVRRHYGELPEAAIPARLQDLIDALDARERRAMRASER